MNRRTLPGLALVIWLVVAATAMAGQTIVIGTRPGAAGPERLAAQELAGYLGKLYPASRFEVKTTPSAGGATILVGSMATDRELIALAGVDLRKPESFAVRTVRRDGRQIGVVAGADPLGTLFGVYALLEKLGSGFYLSGDALPAPRSGPFSFRGWQLDDTPLAADRIVFDWHNFLSGCTGWNLADWQKWTAQSQKMRFNTIMVHAYGNNPMFTFGFNGKTKPVGYLSSTAHGRDWGTEHVSDVRRLVGGEVFSGPVFGADAALAPVEWRAEAAQSLMKKVFADAARRGMHVCFALDVDTESANPQELIATLPASARFQAGKLWFAAPDTPEGYAYYKTQVATLLGLYPQIDRLVVWTRTGKTPWTALELAELPPRWQTEFAALATSNPEAVKPEQAAARFAIGKIIVAFQRALDELGRGGVRLSTGSWAMDWMIVSEPVYPAGVPMIYLDYAVLHGKSDLDSPEQRAELRRLGARRPIVPVVWAHHDDGTYLGRSFTPYADFATKLADAGAGSFGIIHWTMRPLDVYFESLGRQVWSASKNEPLATTCAEMAERWFGPAARASGGEYLHAWVTGAPNFSRETSDFFIDRPFDPETVRQVVAGCRDRLALLRGTGACVENLSYWRDYEEFIAGLFRAEGLYQQACAGLKKGDFATHRQAVAACRPEAVIEQYVRASSHGGMGRSEQGSLVSMNLRWLTYFISLRQAMALEPVRIKFGPTEHEPLAQGAGRLTFWVDRERRFWRVLGAKELGADEFSLPEGSKIEGPPAAAELCRSGIESEGPLSFRLRPFLADLRRNTPQQVGPGAYRVRLLVIDPSSTAAGQRVFEVKIQAAGGQRVDVFQQAGGARRVLELVYPVRLQSPGAVEIRITPITGKALLCAAILEPLQ